MSILSRDCDGHGYYYGFLDGDYRQINVRQEVGDWVAYVGGDMIGAYISKDAAEAAAVKWIRDNPITPDGE